MEQSSCAPIPIIHRVFVSYHLSLWRDIQKLSMSAQLESPTNGMYCGVVYIYCTAHQKICVKCITIVNAVLERDELDEIWLIYFITALFRSSHFFFLSCVCY